MTKVKRVSFVWLEMGLQDALPCQCLLLRFPVSIFQLEVTVPHVLLVNPLLLSAWKLPYE